MINNCIFRGTYIFSIMFIIITLDQLHFFKKYKNIFIFYLNCRRIWIDVVNNDWLIFNSNVILHKIDLIQIQMNWTISNRTRRQLKNCHKYQALVKCHFELIIGKWKIFSLSNLVPLLELKIFLLWIICSQHNQLFINNIIVSRSRLKNLIYFFKFFCLHFIKNYWWKRQHKPQITQPRN